MKGWLTFELISILFNWYLILQVPETARFLLGPLPEGLCYLKQVLRSSFFVELVLLFNASSIAQYIYIFWLKNPLAFQDDFWCWFTAAAIKLFSLCSQFIWHALTPRQPLNYFVCIGMDPTKYAVKPFRVYGFFELMTLLIQVFVQVKIMIYKRKDLGLKLINGSRVSDMEKFSLPSFIVNLFNVAVLATSTFFMIIVSTMEPQKLLVYPNSLMVQFVFLCLPALIGASMAATFYIRHKPLRNAIKKHFFRENIYDVET